MTSSLPHKSSARRAFTMVEILVVIGIIALLATILLPMANRAYSHARRVTMAADLQIISQGLEAYRNDFGDYPRMHSASVIDITGASLLCWALVAPGDHNADGADGPGFRVRGITGTVKGPYLPVDRFTVGIVGIGKALSPNTPTSEVAKGTPAVTFDDSLDVLTDSYYHPILYFPANKSVDPTSTSGTNPFVAESVSLTSPSVFNYGDTSSPKSPPDATGLGIATSPNKLTVKVMRFRLGDLDGDGRIDPTKETAVTTGPYLLWAAGPDGIFGTEDDVADNGASVQLNSAALPPGIYP